MQTFHGEGKNKTQCLECGPNVWWPDRWYRLHCKKSKHGVIHDPPPNPTITPVSDKILAEEKKGIQGRASKVYFEPDEVRLPLMNPYFPFTNATETMLYLWEHCCQPTQESKRMVRAIIQHPRFSVTEVPSEKVMQEMMQALPLLPMYEVALEGQEKPILMHSIIDWIKQLENNPTLQAKMHWQAEFVRARTDIF
jgi:hypothetical protein